MKDFRNTVIETAYHQLAATDPFIWLIEVRVPTTPATRFRITSYASQVIRGTDSSGAPIVWSPFPVAHGDLLEQKEGNLDEVTINVANVTREMMDEIEAYEGLVDQPVVIRLVHSQALNDPAAEERYDGLVTKTRITADVATFVIAATNLSKRLFPRNRLLANECIWLSIGGFGGAQCGYTIPGSPGETVGTGFSTCGGSLSDCEERGDDEDARSVTRKHPERYGGAPGIRIGGGQ